jgi:hypothetical protein
VATHIDICFACRFRLPIAIGDSVVPVVEPVDRWFSGSYRLAMPRIVVHGEREFRLDTREDTVAVWTLRG